MTLIELKSRPHAGTFLSFNPSTRQSRRFGYNLPRESYRLSFNFGVDNLANKLYFENYQLAPVPGRSFVFGITTDFFNLLRKQAQAVINLSVASEWRSSLAAFSLL